MYTLIIISSALIVVGSLLSFLKDILSSNGGKKTHFQVIFPIATLLMGLIGASLTFFSSKKNIDEKIASDSTSLVLRQKNDALIQHEINLVGGGTMKPLLLFNRMSPNEFEIVVFDSSKYTLRDMLITITDNEAFKSFKNKLFKASKDSATYEQNLLSSEMHGVSSDYQLKISIPYLTSLTYQFVKSVYINSTVSYLNYTIDIYWTGGSYTYYIELFKSDTGWREKRREYDRLTGITINN